MPVMRATTALRGCWEAHVRMKRNRVNRPSAADGSGASAVSFVLSQMYNFRWMNTAAVGLILVSTLCGPLSAQWFKYPTPGTPRTPDGKADLTAPAPKSADGHPDLSGVWSPDTRPLQVIAPAKDIPFQPWSAKLSE